MTTAKVSFEIVIPIMSARPNPQALRDLGSSWLHELVAVLGSEQVQARLEEVA
jgi:hypothetical protein